MWHDHQQIPIYSEIGPHVPRVRMAKMGPANDHNHPTSTLHEEFLAGVQHISMHKQKHVHCPGVMIDIHR
jgi:hypothetical protein